MIGYRKSVVIIFNRKMDNVVERLSFSMYNLISNRWFSYYPLTTPYVLHPTSNTLE